MKVNRITAEQLGRNIDAHSKLSVTADTLKYLRRSNTDAFIRDSLEFCSKGNRLALEALLSKVVSANYDIPEKLNIDNCHRED